jgi:hypothetical protein
MEAIDGLRPRLIDYALYQAADARFSDAGLGRDECDDGVGELARLAPRGLDHDRTVT